MRASRVPARSGLVVVVVTLGAALVLGVAPSAQAANIIPNPSFESDCAGVPCQWPFVFDGIPTRDTNSPNSGAASLRLTSTGTFFSVLIRSDCVPVTAGTTYNVSLSYRTTSTEVDRIGFRGIWYSGAGCTGTNSQPGGPTLNTPTKDGAWHQFTGQITPTAPSFDPQSANLHVFYECGVLGDICPENDAVNFDSVFMSSDTLAVTISSLSARRSRQGVVVRWRTASEFDALGYNVYRKRVGQRRVRVNKRLLPALSLSRGGVSGRAYSFVDRRASRHRALRYWVQDVDVRGHRTWHGPVRVAVS
jgi:hypothetical protein